MLSKLLQGGSSSGGFRVSPCFGASGPLLVPVPNPGCKEGHAKELAATLVNSATAP
jgi:hypothetical protein